MTIPETLFLIAGSGRYPSLLMESARACGVKRISVAAFDGETPASTGAEADEVHWMRVGQLGKLLDAARKSGAQHAMMAGQLAPANLFDLRPDVRALMLLARLKRRNAETLFNEVAHQLAQAGLELLNAMTFLDNHVMRSGHLAGPRLRPRDLDDIRFGFDIAKEVSRLDIGQAVVVKTGTVLAVEAFEGTNDCIRRGGKLGRKGAILVKVTKPNQDMRFDVPVIGQTTIEVAKEARLKIIACEANSTLLLDSPVVCQAATQSGVTLYGISR
ncbi:MAG TPA: UDP-2,3-diacylglucosamine diphosphatase LpxI [Terrimicrobiaceae bacterium]